MYVKVYVKYCYTYINSYIYNIYIYDLLCALHITDFILVYHRETVIVKRFLRLKSRVITHTGDSKIRITPIPTQKMINMTVELESESF